MNPFARLAGQTWIIGIVVTAGIAVGACGGEPKAEAGVAAPSLTIVPARAPLGSPIELSFTFAMAADAPPFAEDYRVFVHFMDQDGEKLWIDDHDPPVPTTGWKPGQTIQYTQTTFVPVVPYNGGAYAQLGLYSARDGSRVPLTGEHLGQRAYRAASLELLPQSENVFLLFKDGWQASEISEVDPTQEWQWTKREASIVFANPRRDATFFLQYDGRPDLFPEAQRVRLLVGDHVVDEFAVESPRPAIRKTLIPADRFGSDDKVELRIDAGGVFVPSQIPGAKTTDPRELGLRVYHAYLKPS